MVLRAFGRGLIGLIVAPLAMFGIMALTTSAPMPAGATNAVLRQAEGKQIGPRRFAFCRDRTIFLRVRARELTRGKII
jgi:hypothetical protein